MEREHRHWLTSLSTLVHLSQVRRVAMASFHGKMAASMRETFTMMNSVVVARTAGLMAQFTRESGAKARCMDRGCSLWGMVVGMKAASQTTRKRATESTTGRMERLIRESGWMGSSMERASISGQMERKEKDCGKQASALGG